MIQQSSIHPFVERRVNCSPSGDGCKKVDDMRESINDVNKRLDDGYNRMGRIETNIEDVRATMLDTHARFEAKLDANSQATAATAESAKETAESMSEVRDIFALGKSFFRIMGYAGTLVKWGAGIATAIVGLWFTFKYGKPPP